MGDEDWEGIREEHRAIGETMREYLGTLHTARELVDSSVGQMERSRMLLSRYYRMRELAHLADIQIARAGEALMLDMVRNNGKA